MHVLIIPNSFPSYLHPYRGIFYKKYAEALSAFGVQTGVVIPEVHGFREIKNIMLWKKTIKMEEFSEGQLKMVRKTSFNLLPGFPAFQEYIFPSLVNKLFKLYQTKNGRPDVLHAQLGLYAGLAAKRLSEKTGIPYIVTEHSSAYLTGDYSPHQEKRVMDVYNSATFVIAVGNRLGEKVQRHTDHPVTVIPNLVNTELFKLPEAFQENHVLFSAGNLTKNKRFDILLKSFSNALKKQPAWKLRIAGDGPEKERLKKITRELRIEKKVRFLGKLQQDAIARELQNSSAFILTSEVETFGVVYLEAMATGTPVIGTRSGGPEDFVPSFAGELCEVNDIEEICKAILTLKEKSYDPEKIRNYVVKNFSAKAIIEKYIPIYQQAIDQTNEKP